MNNIPIPANYLASVFDFPSTAFDTERYLLIRNGEIPDVNLRQKALGLYFLILVFGRRKILFFQADIQACEAFNDFRQFEIIGGA